MVVKWQFYDPSIPQTYTFEINPNEDGLPAYKKNFASVSTSAPNGKTIVFQGRTEAERGSFSGVTLSQAQHEAFVLWFKKANQIRVTDDLGRSFWILIEGYDPKRRRSYQHPYKHDYTISYVVVDW